MWFLILLTAVNCSMGYKGSFNDMRFMLAGVPINIIDVMMFVGLGLVPFWIRRSSQWGKHPLFAVLMTLCIVSLAGGLAMSLVNVAQGKVDVRGMISFARNFAAIPMGLLIGYAVLRDYRSTVTISYLMAFAGCVTATMILRYFLGKAEGFGEGTSINALRTVDYLQVYAGSATGLLLCSVLQGARLFPTPVALAMAGYCIVGLFAGLSRSDWLASVAMMGAVMTCVPRDRLALRMMQGLLGLLTVAVALWIGVEVAARVTGTDFRGKMATRIRSMLPGEQEGVKFKAWDTRLIGAQREIEEGLRSPLIGRGFGFQDSPDMLDAEPYGTRHNSWTNAFVETGLLGLVTEAVLIGGCVVVGRRMIKARTDLGTVLIGSLGLATAAYYGALGFMTGSFNNQRAGIHLGITVGLVLRARMMQASIVREYAGYVDFGEGGGEAEPLALPLTSDGTPGGYY